ncbi:hypothetical protein LINPERPRIM_LOCUS19653 [Linum perenne]
MVRHCLIRKVRVPRSVKSFFSRRTCPSLLVLLCRCIDPVSGI